MNSSTTIRNHQSKFYFTGLMGKLFLILLLTTVAACSKKSGGEKDREAPAIVVTTPVDNQVFTGGQSMAITGSVTDNKYISQIHIEISNFQTGQEYLHVHIHPDAASFNFNQAYTVASGIEYRIRVIAEDASSNSSVKSINVVTN